MNVLAIDAGGTFIKYAIIDQDANILLQDKYPTDRDHRDVFFGSIVDIYNKYKAEYGLTGIGMSLPVICEPDTTLTHGGSWINCIDNLNFTEEMAKYTDAKVSIENDARCAAKAELWDGALKDVNNGAIVALGTGVGGAVVIDRKVLYGKNFTAGELSWLVMDGQGNLQDEYLSDTVAGVPNLIRLAAAAKGVDPDTLTGEKVFEMAEAGDEEVIAALHKYARYVGVICTNLMNTVNPDIIGIGGGISAAPMFLTVLREEIAKIYEGRDLDQPTVERCKYMNDANLIGAASTWFNKYN